MGVDNPIFNRLRIAGWRQFDFVEFDFHRRLTVLTGANGAGKSTILNILTRHFGISRPYLSVPHKTAKGGIQFFSGLFEIEFSKRLSRLFDWTRPSPQHLGELTLTNGAVSPLVVPPNAGLSYDLTIENQQPVLGFHVPSHRLLPIYQALPEQIPVRGIDTNSAFHILINENYQRYRGGHTNSSVIFQIKQILMAWKVAGEGSSIFDADPLQRDAYLGFVKILKKIIPEELGFEDIIFRFPDVLLQTKSGTFLIDAASGGLVTLIELAAIIYACSIQTDVKGGPFVVTFDEPENHLHPALQRMLLPTLVDAFPTAQFIIATHSPFMVSSVKDSNVYVLRFIESEALSASDFQINSTRRVEGIKLDYANRAGTAGEVLRDVLGVPVTLPAWVEKRLTEITERYASRSLNADTITDLRNELRAAGLTELFSEAITLLGRGR